MNIDSDLLKESIKPDGMISLINEMGGTLADDKRDKGFIIFDTICHNHPGQGSPKLYYYLESHSFHCYTGCSCSFDIYNLVERVYGLRKVELHFSSIVDYVATQTGYQVPMGFGSAFQMPVETQTSGDLEWLNKLTSRKKRELPDIPTYHDELLKVFTRWHHDMFLEDHILPSVMDAFHIGYHDSTERISFVYREPKNGRIIGFRGRTTKEDDPNKYLPLYIQGKQYNFPSYATMYGIWENRENIKKARKCFIYEAEKSVLQCASYYGLNNNLALGLMGKNFSDFHTQMLLDLGVEEITLCFDKMYEKVDHNTADWIEYEEIVMKAVKKLTPYFRTFICFDRSGLLQKDDSPSDRGKETLEALLSRKVELYTRGE